MYTNRIGQVFLGCCCAAMLSAASVQAGTVQLKYAGLGGGKNVTISSVRLGGTVANPATRTGYTGVLKFQTGSVDAGTMLNANSNYVGFCTELAQYASGSFKTYNEVEVSELPTPGQEMGIAASTAIAKMWHVAAGRQFTTDDFGAAFQVAIWEAAEDLSSTGFPGVDGPLDILSGNFMYGGGLSTEGKAFLDELIGVANTATYTGRVSLKGYGSGSNQDYIIAVPEPTSFSLLAIGGICIAGCGLRRRRLA